MRQHTPLTTKTLPVHSLSWKHFITVLMLSGVQYYLIVGLFLWWMFYIGICHGLTTKPTLVHPLWLHHPTCMQQNSRHTHEWLLHPLVWVVPGCKHWWQMDNTDVFMVCLIVLCATDEHTYRINKSCCVFHCILKQGRVGTRHQNRLEVFPVW